jgi:hypothetical protein
MSKNNIVSITVRISRADYEAFQAKCLRCEPPTNPTNVLRWLLQRWLTS